LGGGAGSPDGGPGSGLRGSGCKEGWEENSTKDEGVEVIICSGTTGCEGPGEGDLWGLFDRKVDGVGVVDRWSMTRRCW
jgi:hypothetical protein